MQQYDLVALRSFVAVVDTGNFNQAAEQLNASTAAISRRVSNLENALGVRLLNRTTRRVELTDAGQQFYQDMVNIFSSLDEAQERLQTGNQHIRGSLRVSAPLSLGITSFSPIMTGFMKQHPELNVHLQLADYRTDFVAEGIDVGIRVGRLEDSSLVAIPITTEPAVFCASPDYIAEHGEPENPLALTKHNCLMYSLVDPKMGWVYQENGEEHTIAVNGTLTSNNGNALKDAAVAGIGITLSPKFIVEEALARGELVEVLKAYRPNSLGLYAIKLSRKHTPAKVTAFIEYLQAHYQAVENVKKHVI